MAGKVGLAAERVFLAERWEAERSFVLLHDLTTCLRIGDATEFRTVGEGYEAYLHEIKTNPLRIGGAQLHRQHLAEQAIRDGGPLPNDADARLVALDMPYRTHLVLLREAFRKAATRGVQGMKVPGGRALMAANLPRGYELWTEEEFLDRSADERDAACQRAGIRGRGHHVTSISSDTVARSPITPPWAIYPLPFDVCAALIADQAVFSVTISSESLITALQDAGLWAEWLVPDDARHIDHNQEIARIHNRKRMTVMRLSELERLTFELVDLPLWANSVKEMLARADIVGRPWPCFADEGRVWARGH
jgi:hypothetical protein